MKGNVNELDEEHYDQTFSTSHALTLTVDEQLARAFADRGGRLPVTIQIWDGAGPPAVAKPGSPPAKGAKGELAGSDRYTVPLQADDVGGKRRRTSLIVTTMQFLWSNFCTCAQ